MTPQRNPRICQPTQPCRRSIAEAADRSDTTESTSTEQPDQADSDADAEQAAEPEPQPQPSPALARLGGRFSWCADVQENFDELAEHQAAIAAAEADLQDAQTTLDTSTDELDRVEARRARDSAAEHLDWLRSRGAVYTAAGWLFTTGFQSSDETRHIAFERALTAYDEAAHPDVVALIWATVELQTGQDYGTQPTPLDPALSFGIDLQDIFPADFGVLPALSTEDALAAIDDYRYAALAVAEDAAKTQTDGWRAFQEAETPGEMLAAHTVIAESAIALKQVRDAVSDVRDYSSDVLDDGGRLRDRDVYLAIRDALRTVSDATRTEANFSEMERRIEALALADEAGLGAFWRSLADSCAL